MENQLITSLSSHRVVYPNTTSILNVNSKGIYERECTNTLLQLLKADKSPQQIIHLHGIRQSGKTTLMIQVIKRLSREVGAESIFYCDVEGNRIQHGEHLQKVLEFAKQLGKKYIFLDHLEGLTGWEGVVESFDGGVQFIVSRTGGFVPLEHNERYVDVHLRPYSFKEFVQAWAEGSGTRKVPTRRALFEIYLRRGGFPVVVNSLIEGNDKYCADYLSGLSEEILKDVNSGGQININNLQIYNTISGIQYDKDIAQKLQQVDYAQSASSSSQKMYCIDNGLLNTIRPKEEDEKNSEQKTQQVVFYYLSSRNTSVSEDSSLLMSVDNTKFFFTVNRKEDLMKGLFQFYQKFRQNQGKQIYLILIGSYGGLFTNNINFLQKCSPLFNCWGTIKKLFMKNTTGKSKEFTKEDFKNCMEKLFEEEKTYLHSYFLLKILVQRILKQNWGVENIVNNIWKYLAPQLLVNLSQLGYDNSSSYFLR